MLGLMLAAKLIQPRVRVRISKDEGSNFDHSNDTLTIGTDLEEDYGFMSHLEEIHRCNFAREYNQRLWTILHEIGHYEMDEVEDEETDNGMLYATMVSFVDENYANQMYFNLPREWTATEWAIEWILLNPHKAKFLNWLAQF